MAANPRHTYPLADLARVRSGKRTIVPVHENWCPSLSSGHMAECTCGDALTYRLVAVKGRAR